MKHIISKKRDHKNSRKDRQIIEKGQKLDKRAATVHGI